MTIFICPPAWAACTAPAGVAGEILLNQDTSPPSLQYCNQYAWVDFPQKKSADKWVQISTSVDWSAPYACGIATDGSAWCWGDDANGRLGNGAALTSMQTTPSPVAGGYKWKQISAAYQHTCGIRSDGAAMCWGGETGFYDLLGDGVGAGQADEPVLVAGGYTWSKISAGQGHTCGIRTDGIAMCWGSDFGGRLGNGAGGDTNAPGLVTGGYTWADISAGNVYTCGVTTAGVGYCWGDSDVGVRGDGTTSTPAQDPTLVSGGHTWQKISATDYQTTCGLTTAGDGYCWGSAYEGRLGNGTTSPDQTTPVLVLGGHTWVDISAGTNASCGLTAGNVLYCWGDNSYDSTGTGATRTTPFIVNGNYEWASMQIGGALGCGVLTNGNGVCWGRGDTGGLGNGDTSSNAGTPVPVTFGSSCTLSSWTPGPAPTTSGWFGIAYGNGTFVAVGETGADRIMRSTDGENWSAVTAPQLNTWQKITFGNDRFVAVSYDGAKRSMVSTDNGATWTMTDIDTSTQWRSVAYGNDRFVASAWWPQGRFAYSTNNGTSWTTVNSGLPDASAKVVFGNGIFVSAAYRGGGGGDTATIYTSPDGASWTAQSTGITLGGDGWNDITYGGGRFVAVGSADIMTSTDGINWTAGTVPSGTWGWSAVTYMAGKFYAFASSGSTTIVATSVDGANWTLNGGDAQYDGSPSAAASGLGHVVVVTYSGANQLSSATCTFSGCTGPTADVGTLMFNGDHSVMQWCNGDWQSIGPADAGNAAGNCTSPAGPAGRIVYDDTFKVLKYCNGVNWIRIGALPCKSCGGSADEKVVFLYEAQNGYGIGGISGGDTKCQNRANNYGLKGTYKAWLADSDPNSAPAVRFTHPNVPYVRPDGVKVADNWTDLTDGSLDTSIQVIQTGTWTTQNGNAVFTNVKQDGTQYSSASNFNCIDWTTPGTNGHRGLKSSLTEWSSWNQSGSYSTICSATARIYCFEQ